MELIMELIFSNFQIDFQIKDKDDLQSALMLFPNN